MDPLDVTTLNPHLAPIKDQANNVWNAIARFKRDRGVAPVYIRVNPRDWRSPIISGYCGLITIKDRKVWEFELDVERREDDE